MRSQVQMESSVKQSLDAFEVQSIALEDSETKNDEKSRKEVEKTRKNKSNKIRFSTSVNGSNSVDNKKQTVQHGQRYSLKGSERKPRKHKSEANCWKLEYKSNYHHKQEGLEKLKQEIYERNIQRDLGLQIKSRFGLRSVSTIGQDVTFTNCLKKRDSVSRDVRGVDSEQKKDTGQVCLAPEIKYLRVKSTTRLRAKTTPLKNRSGMTVDDRMSSSTIPGLELGTDKRHATFSGHGEKHETKTFNPKHFRETSREPACETASKPEGVFNKAAGNRYTSNATVNTKEILEKYFSSNIFPPLSRRCNNEDKRNENELHNNSSHQKCSNLECTWNKDEDDVPIKALHEAKDVTNLTEKSVITAWGKESDELREKIKTFIEKPVPELSPLSLMIHRRSTVADISLGGFSKGGTTIAHVPVLERKKSIGVVNLHTCPNYLNVFTDRSWMYQDRRAEKCRYIRAPQTPIPPISEVFHHKKETQKKNPKAP